MTTSVVDLGAEFARLYAACKAPVPADDSIVTVDLGEETSSGDRNELLIEAMTGIDHASVVASSGDAVLLHASAVLAAEGPVLLVGPSGAGKSTLAAALVSRGWSYVGDEVIGLDEDATNVLANPKPWKLDHRSRSALADYGGFDGLALDASTSEVLVAPRDVGPVCPLGSVGRPAAIVRVGFREGARASVSAMSRADGAEVLADQCFNFAQWGARALDTVAALARRVPALHLEFGDVTGAVAAIQQALR